MRWLLAACALALSLGFAPASDAQAARIDSRCPQPASYYESLPSQLRLDGPDGDWLRRVLARTGLPVLSETGTALVTCLDGHDVYVSAAGPAPPGAREPTMRRVGTVRGTRVFAHDVRAMWRTREATVWVHAGPSSPRVAGFPALRPLVESSLRVPVLRKSRWVTRRLGDTGLKIRTPLEWKIASGPLIPALGRMRGPGPRMRELFAAGTFELPAGSGECGPLPERAVARMGPDDALLVLYETTGRKNTRGGFYARPARLTPWSPARYGGRSVMRACLEAQFHDRFLRFLDEGRIVHAYLAWGAETDATTRAQLWATLNSLRLKRKPVPLMPTPSHALAACRELDLARAACPTRVPRFPHARRPSLVQVFACRSHPRRCLGPGVDVFDLAWGAEDPGNPKHNRPPRLVHLAVYGGPRIERGFPWTPDVDVKKKARDSLTLDPDRTAPIRLGTRAWNGRNGTLTLAPPFPHGGQQGNHLIYQWTDSGDNYAVGLHAWEPLTEAIATLEAVIASVPSG